MNRLIPLSTIEYFTQGNTMIGSVTPEELVADPLAKLFHYRAFADGDKLTVFGNFRKICAVFDAHEIFDGQ